MQIGLAYGCNYIAETVTTGKPHPLNNFLCAYVVLTLGILHVLHTYIQCDTDIQ